MAATVAEIGRLAGCSIATVSRVLNNSGSVSPETRESILKAMRETQYRSKSAVRRGRSTGRNGGSGQGVVEVIQHRHSPVESLSLDHGELEVGPTVELYEGSSVPRSWHLGNAFHRRIVDGVVEELSRWGWRAQLQINTDLLDPQLVAEMNGPEHGGILLIGEYSADLPKFVDQCLHPLVLVDLVHDGPADVVTIDNLVGISAAFEHLRSLGHERIGFVGKRDDVVAFAERFTAYKLRMIEAGLAVRTEWVYEGPDHIEATAGAVRAILERPERPTALVCSNDCYALGVVRAANSLGLSIPERLSVVGFDDVEFASLVTPPLTTVRVPLREMGRQAVRELMGQVQVGVSPRHRGCHVRLLPDLVVRRSTAAPA